MARVRPSEAPLPVCEDSDGSTFRRDHWQRRCMKLCRDGLRENCAVTPPRLHCYWKDAGVNRPADIDDDRILKLSGFARGDFNYRIAAMGLNSSLDEYRDCSNPRRLRPASEAADPIQHHPPGAVPGAQLRRSGLQCRAVHGPGSSTRAPWRPSATSPTRSAPPTASSITPYMRSELNGRPLDGTFSIRVWEEEGVAFDRIRGVQLVLDYRYWTRFH